MAVAAGVVALGTVLAGQVPYSRIVNAVKEPGAWLTYSGTYDGQRHSTLAQITTANVAQLQPSWIYQVRGEGEVETSPIVADGRMYVTEPPTTVTALDPRTGRTLWSYMRPMPSDLRLIGFPATNRGVAILDDMVYVGSLDGALIALDAETGAKRWETKVADNGTGHSITMAPLALDGKVIVGISGGEAGIRGFVDAYHAKTGALVWRSYTVPAAGESGVETWAGDSWKNGAGATWLTGSYDPELRLLYWGTGNPGPDWNGDVRKGDNLYTSSVVALDPDTGKIKWHFQYTPHDTHDWDANQIQVLADLQIGGRSRKALITATATASNTCWTARPASSSTLPRTRSRRGRRASMPRAGPRCCRTPSPRPRGTSSTRACRAPRTGPARPTARRRGSSMCRCGKWARTTTRPTSSTSRGCPSPAAASVAWRMRRGARSARSTRRRARRCGTSGCPHRRGPACSPPRAAWYSAARTRATSTRWTRKPGRPCGSSRRAAGCRARVSRRA
jgi:outer membrane protein assembly factor BamB